MPQFFVSYDHLSGADFAREVCNRINSSGAGITAWSDLNISLGEQWKQAIDTAIQDAAGVIVIVTLNSLISPYVTYEWAYALGKEKRILPIVIETPDPQNPEHPKFHPKLIDHQYLDFTSIEHRDWKRLIGELVAIARDKEVPADVEDAKNDMYSSDPDRRSHGINHLRDYDHPAATEALAGAVLSPHPQLSILAAFALSRKTNNQDQRALPGLEKALSRGGTMEEAIEILRSMNNPAAVGCLERAMTVSKSEHERSKMIKAMAAMTDPTVIPELRRHLVDPSNRSKYYAVIDALGKFRDPQALPELLQYLASLAEPVYDGKVDEAKTRVLIAVSKIGHPDAIVPLIEMIRVHTKKRPPQINMVHDIIRTIEEIGGEAAVHHLNEFVKEPISSHYHAEISMAMQVIEDKLNAQSR